ncbi:MAG: DUF192 domain-containing protein, partial [Patescibacteria group bacterium]
GLVLGVSVLLRPFIKDISKADHEYQVRIGNQIIVAEAVGSGNERERGLSGRESIGANEGMLFIFEKPDKYGFWMKDMEFGIDIVWLKDYKIVGFTENIDPQIGAKLADLKVYYPSEPVNMVLEIKAGRVKLLGTKVGDNIKTKPLVFR